MYPYVIHRKSLLFPWIRSGLYGRQECNYNSIVYHNGENISFQILWLFDPFFTVSRLKDVIFFDVWGNTCENEVISIYYINCLTPWATMSSAYTIYWFSGVIHFVISLQSLPISVLFPRVQDYTTLPVTVLWHSTNRYAVYRYACHNL